MRAFLVLMAISVAAVTSGSVKGSEQIAIRIDEIRENDYIAGSVTGLTKKGRGQLKVVVYVETDKWYIHPYERGGENKSWASIQANGSWTIETIRREFAASRVAALLVERDSRPPSTTANVRSIPNEAIVVRELEGTTDYGKL